MPKPVLFHAFVAHVDALNKNEEFEKARMIVFQFLAFVFMFLGGTADALCNWLCSHDDYRYGTLEQIMVRFGWNPPHGANQSNCRLHAACWCGLVPRRSNFMRSIATHCSKNNVHP
jgi:hypothetical protein